MSGVIVVTHAVFIYLYHECILMRELQMNQYSSMTTHTSGDCIQGNRKPT